MLAQRYPTSFDGIAAGAPAIQWDDIFPSVLWPQQFMNILGEFPHPCELQAITAAAVSACDALDGVVDGIITNVDDCQASFRPFDLIGSATNCSEARVVTSAAAAVVNATWQGMRNSQGVQMWFGLNPGTDLTVGVAGTNCTAQSCVGVPFAVAAQWFTLFIARDADFDLTNLSHVEFDTMAHRGRQTYDSIIGTKDADLSAFRNAGGKLVTFHGLVSVRPIAVFSVLIFSKSSTPDFVHRMMSRFLRKARSSTTMKSRTSFRMSTTSTATLKCPE